MSSPVVTDNALSRIAVAVVGLAFAVFFGVLGVSIVLAPPVGEQPAWALWFIRGFIALLFGAMAGGGLHFMVQAIRGEHEPSLPRAVRARCPGCGEPGSAEGACASCHLPRAGLWQDQPSTDVGVGSLLFGGAMGGGLACLGLFMLSTALFGSETLLLSVLSFALGLLLLGVGGAFLLGVGLGAAASWRTRHVRELQLRHDDGEGCVVAAAAHAKRGELTMDGSTQRWTPIAEAPEGPAADLPPIARELARVVAVLHAREEVTLSVVESTDWSWVPGRAPDALERRASTDVCIDEAETLELPGAEEARRLVHFALTTKSLLRATAAATADPELAAAVEACAAHLSAEEADPRVLATLGRVLRGAPASATPYRARG